MRVPGLEDTVTRNPKKKREGRRNGILSEISRKRKWGQRKEQRRRRAG